MNYGSDSSDEGEITDPTFLQYALLGPHLDGLGDLPTSVTFAEDTLALFSSAIKHPIMSRHYNIMELVHGSYGFGRIAYRVRNP